MIKSENEAIADILQSIDKGKIQLPDFQRGWVWEDNRIRALIASISNGYPIGAAMFLQTGSDEVNFKYRLFEGVDKSFAIQAGREVRIIVKPENVDDDKMALIMG